MDDSDIMVAVVAPSLASLGLGVRSSLACVLRVCACCARAHSLCACVSVVSHPQVMEGFGYNIYSDLLPSLLRLVEARLREFTAVIKLSGPSQLGFHFQTPVGGGSWSASLGQTHAPNGNGAHTRARVWLGARCGGRASALRRWDFECD